MPERPDAPTPTPSDNTPPLLSYAFANLPDPLQVGTPASLTLTVDNATGAKVTCQQIVVTLPRGINADDLVAAADIEVVPPEGWTIAKDGGIVTFAAPGGGVEIEGGGLTFVFAVTINDKPGPATVTIDEAASDAANALAKRSTSWATAKFPVDFSLSALTAVPPGNTDIAYGAAAQLDWAATGAGVSCTLEYQPADSGTPVSASVPNLPGQAYATEPLTRSGDVVFTLTAYVTPAGQDAPLTRQSQLTVSVEKLSLAVVVEPPRIGTNGLVRLTWNAPNADHCTDETGVMMAASGRRYIVLAAARTFIITAVGAGGQIVQQSAAVALDAGIGATESGYSQVGQAGADFTPNAAGQPGQPASVSATLPPLDPSGKPSRVIPITVTGGNGGAGTPAAVYNFDYWCPGGIGGDATLTAEWDPSQPPAQFLISVTGGIGGMGGDEHHETVQAPSGTATATIGGVTIELP